MPEFHLITRKISTYNSNLLEFTGDISGPTLRGWAASRRIYASRIIEIFGLLAGI
jgi:hypothetical protein